MNARHQEQVLTRSLEQYRELLSRTEEIDQKLGDLDAPELRSRVEALGELTEAIKETDQAVNALLRNEASCRENPLFRQRVALIEKIVAMNRELSPKIMGCMAVRQEEIKKLRKGIHTVSGYVRSPQPAGKRINSKC